MGTIAAYTDVPDFLANATGNVETATLVGGNSTLASSITLGASSLPLLSTTGFPPSGVFAAFILDGLFSEKVVAQVSGSNLILTGVTAAAHSVGVSVSSAGSQGCLADVILRASRSIDNFCRQGPDGSSDRSLFALSRVENLRGPSLRAAYDTASTLTLWPRRWPIQSITSIAIQYGTLAPVLMSLGSPLITDGLRTIEVSAQGVILPPSPMSMRMPWFVAVLTYVAGACGSGALAGVPDDIREACHLFIADLLAQRQNPYGLSDVQQGKLHRTFRNRGDQWTSMFRERAYELLDPYAVDMYGVTQ